jgi:hypothetical protein
MAELGLSMQALPHAKSPPGVLPAGFKGYAELHHGLNFTRMKAYDFTCHSDWLSLVNARSSCQQRRVKIPFLASHYYSMMTR